MTYYINVTAIEVDMTPIVAVSWFLCRGKMMMAMTRPAPASTMASTSYPSIGRPSLLSFPKVSCCLHP